MVLNRAIFLDKDGTLIEDVPYNVDPYFIELTSGAIGSIKVFHQLNYQIFIISNQSGIARGYFTEKELEPVIQFFNQLFEALSIPLTGFYYCPHHPEGSVSPYNIECECRKPKPGLIQQAAMEHSIDLAQSWFIGDILHDTEAGRRAGCRTILIDNGNETEWQLTRNNLPHHVVNNLREASTIVKALHENTTTDIR
jgi:D,D-heptose 1,7-bisphosphate phosphatase